MQLPLLWEKTGALAIVELGLMAGRLTGSQAGRPLGRRNCCKVILYILLLKCILGTLNRFFSIDKDVLVDLFPIFSADTITVLFILVRFHGSHIFPCQSLLLNTTILNNMTTYMYNTH